MRKLVMCAVIGLTMLPLAARADDSQQEVRCQITAAGTASSSCDPLTFLAGLREISIDWSPGSSGIVRTDLVDATGATVYSVSCALSLGLPTCDSNATVPVAEPFYPTGIGWFSGSGEYRADLVLPDDVSIMFSVDPANVASACTGACISASGAYGVFSYLDG